MRKTDIIIIAAICTVLLGGAVTALILINRPASSIPIKEIIVNSPPSKITYARGEEINTSGLRIGILHEDGSSSFVSSGFTISPSIATNGSNANATDIPQTITVTYKKHTTTFTITVGPAIIRSMSILSEPTKTEYTRNEPFSWVGFEVRLTMTDGTTKDLRWNDPELTLPTVSTSETGIRQITVTYEEFNVQFDIIVRA